MNSSTKGAVICASLAGTPPKMPIPKILHYIWVGHKPFEAQGVIDHWRQVMPGYQVMFWNEANIDFSAPFIRNAYAARAYNRVANYARLAALKSHGGVYLDHDVEVVRPFDDLLGHECFFGFQSDNPAEFDTINNAVIGAVPNHAFIAQLLGELDSMDGAVDVGSGSGPGLVSRVLRAASPLPNSIEVPTDHCGVALMPKRYFYPYSWQEDFDPACITPDCFAIHHWAHSWRPERSWRKRANKKLRKALIGLFPDLMFGFTRWHNRLRGRRPGSA